MSAALLKLASDLTRREFAGAIEQGKQRADAIWRRGTQPHCLYCDMPTSEPDSYCTPECAVRAETER